MKDIVYMAVSKDKYRLPVAVADSPMELAQIVGVNYNTVMSVISKWRHGIIKNARYIAVNMDGADDLE